MSGFESLEQAIVPSVAGILTEEQTAFGDEQFSDEAALQLVLGDVQLAEQFVQSHNMPLDWNTSDEAFRAAPIMRTWNDGKKPRSALSMPVVMEATEKLMPPLLLSFFSDKQPFLLKPLGKTTPQAAR